MLFLKGGRLLSKGRGRGHSKGVGRVFLNGGVVLQGGSFKRGGCFSGGRGFPHGDDRSQQVLQVGLIIHLCGVVTARTQSRQTVTEGRRRPTYTGGIVGGP